MAKSSRTRERRPPWGGMTALFGASLVTLLGVACGLEPATILFRAFLVGVLLGVLASVASTLLSPIPRSP